MAIRFFDMFAGIGGFRSGLEAVGGFECIGHCEIDPYPNKAYNAIFDTRGEYYCDDARKINPGEMPDFDLENDFAAYNNHYFGREQSIIATVEQSKDPSPLQTLFYNMAVAKEGAPCAPEERNMPR